MRRFRPPALPPVAPAFARHGGDAALILDPRWHVVWANEAARQQLEVSVVGLPLLHLLAQGEGPRVQGALEILDGEGGAIGLDVRLDDARAAELIAWREGEDRGVWIRVAPVSAGLVLLHEIIGHAQGMADAEALDLLVRRMTLFLGLDAGHLALLEDDALTVCHADPVATDPPGRVFPRDGSTAALALRQIDRVSSVPELPVPRHHGVIPARSYLGCALVRSGRPIGVLGFAGRVPRRGFSSSERQVVAFAARWAVGRLPRSRTDPPAPDPQGIIDALPGPAILTDPDLRVTAVSPGIGTLLGYRSGELAGQPLGRVVGAARLAPGVVDLALEDRDGALVTVRADITEVWGSTGRRSGWMLTLSPAEAAPPRS